MYKCELLSEVPINAADDQCVIYRGCLRFRAIRWQHNKVRSERVVIRTHNYHNTKGYVFGKFVKYLVRQN